MKIIETRQAPNPAPRPHFSGREGHHGAVRGARPDEGRPEDARVHQAEPVPARAVLVLDDGTAISETMAICRYFEETQAGAGPVRPFGASARPTSRCGTAAWSSACWPMSPTPSAIPTRRWPTSRCRRSRTGARPTRPRRSRCSAMLDAQLAGNRIRRRRRLLGRRHHGAGRRRLHAAGPHHAATGAEERRALVRRGFGPAERQGLRRRHAGRTTGRTITP